MLAGKMGEGGVVLVVPAVDSYHDERCLEDRSARMKSEKVVHNFALYML